MKNCDYWSYFKKHATIMFLLILAFSIHSESNILSNSWTRAVKQTLYEQEVEDVNAVHKVNSHLVRRLIVMPLTDAFNPSQVNGMHGKVQYGDKCSLPGTIGRTIFEKPYEVPWLFEITPVKRTSTSTSSVMLSSSMLSSMDEDESSGKSSNITVKKLPKAYISPLDFRSPENYIFLPRWLMATLDVKVRDLVDISFVRIKLASLVVLQPLTLDWDTIILKSGRDPKTVLEHEVNKYSSLTAGATIYIEVDGIELPILVKETFAEGGISVKGVRVQDSDIQVDIDRSVLDEIIKRQKKKAAELLASKLAEVEKKTTRKLST